MKSPCMKHSIRNLFLFSAIVLSAYWLGKMHAESLITQAQQDQTDGELFMQGAGDVRQALVRFEEQLIELQMNMADPVEHQTSAEASLTVSLLKRMNSLERRLDTIDSQNSNREILSDNGTIDQVTPPHKNQAIQDKELARLQQIHEDLETRLNVEQTFPGWTAQVTDKIQTVLSRLQQNFGQRSSLLDVDCKTSLCRVEMMHAPNDDRTLLEFDMLATLGNDFGESTSREIRDSDGNVQRTVYYFARRGSSILNLE